MNTFVQFNGENYSEVLKVFQGRVHSDGKTVRLFVSIPEKGEVEINKGDYVLSENGKVKIKR